jgi:hypothetical protein
VQRGKRALGIEEEGHAVATTKKNSSKPQPNKNALDIVFSWRTKHREKRDNLFVEFILCL